MFCLYSLSDNSMIQLDDTTIKDVLTWGFIILLFCFIICTLFCNTYELDDIKDKPDKTECMIDIPKIDPSTSAKWTKTDSCKFYMDTTTSNALKDAHMTKT